MNPDMSKEYDVYAWVTDNDGEWHRHKINGYPLLPSSLIALFSMDIEHIEQRVNKDGRYDEKYHNMLLCVVDAGSPAPDIPSIR